MLHLKNASKEDTVPAYVMSDGIERIEIGLLNNNTHELQDAVHYYRLVRVQKAAPANVAVILLQPQKAHEEPADKKLVKFNPYKKDEQRN